MARVSVAIHTVLHCCCYALCRVLGAWLNKHLYHFLVPCLSVALGVVVLGGGVGVQLGVSQVEGTLSSICPALPTGLYAHKGVITGGVGGVQVVCVVAQGNMGAFCIEGGRGRGVFSDGGAWVGVAGVWLLHQALGQCLGQVRRR